MKVIQDQQATGPGLRLSPDVAVIVMDDGSARLVDMARSFYSLPASATFILERVLTVGMSKAKEELEKRFDIGASQASRDIECFVDDLKAKGILIEGGRTPTPRSFLASLLGRLMKWSVTLIPPHRMRTFVVLTLARLSCKWFGWVKTYHAWNGRLRRRGDALPTPLQRRRLDRIQTDVAEVGSRHILGMDCKERALACWALARSRGIPATMVIGGEFYPPSGHVWCEVEDRIISDDEENCRRYERLLRYV